MNLQDRFQKLQARAAADAGTSEGETAARLAAAMLRRWPDLVVQETAPISRVFATRHGYDRELLTSIAGYLGLDAFKIGHHRPGKGPRWREGLSIVGSAELLDFAGELYAEHRRHLDELLSWTAVGYALGAFPFQETEEQDEGDEAPSIPPELLGVALAGREAGQRLRAAPPGPPPKRITADPVG